MRTPASCSVARAIADNISQRLQLCSPDELRVLDALLGRLEIGRERYGHLDLSLARDWDRELAEEWADVAVYKAIGKVLERDRTIDRMERLHSAQALKNLRVTGGSER